jgi:hypothetical protein
MFADSMKKADPTIKAGTVVFNVSANRQTVKLTTTNGPVFSRACLICRAERILYRFMRARKGCITESRFQSASDMLEPLPENASS